MTLLQLLWSNLHSYLKDLAPHFNLESWYSPGSTFCWFSLTSQSNYDAIVKEHYSFAFLLRSLTFRTSCLEEFLADYFLKHAKVSFIFSVEFALFLKSLICYITLQMIKVVMARPLFNKHFRSSWTLVFLFLLSLLLHKKIHIATLSHVGRIFYISSFWLQELLPIVDFDNPSYLATGCISFTPTQDVLIII